MTIRVAAFYKFQDLPDYTDRQQPLLDRLKKLGIKGSVLLANEGINGTVAGPFAAIVEAMSAIAEITGVEGADVKYSETATMPFKRLKVRLKKEIVTIGNVNANPNEKVGTYVEPEDWNELIRDPNVILIDTRNDYEVSIGTFKNAIDPHTDSFGEFPDYVRKVLKAPKDAKIAMFCTGGIRCEKASSFMMHEGFKNVYHLKGGILKYLEVTAQEKSLWEGSCFVFDERVSVEHGLKVGDHSMCFGCMEPVTVEEREKPGYELGVSCPKCFPNLTETQLASNRERQKQSVLARKRGESHLGPKES